MIVCDNRMQLVNFTNKDITDQLEEIFNADDVLDESVSGMPVNEKVKHLRLPKPTMKLYQPTKKPQNEDNYEKK